VRKLRPVLIAIVTALVAPTVLGACTAQELAFFSEVTSPTREALTDGQLEALRRCESGGDYGAVSRSGTYRGAYQFSQSTWNGVAERHYPWLQGVDPAVAEWYWQDAMARALFSESGRSPWPHCGRRL
jgi:hypothetical protein